jgi:hypothetical protein
MTWTRFPQSMAAASTLRRIRPSAKATTPRYAGASRGTLISTRQRDGPRSITVCVVAGTPPTRHDHVRRGAVSTQSMTRNGSHNPTGLCTAPVAPAWTCPAPSSSRAARTVGPHCGQFSSSISSRHARSLGASMSVPRLGRTCRPYRNCRPGAARLRQPAPCTLTRASNPSSPGPLSPPRMPTTTPMATS